VLSFQHRSRCERVCLGHLPLREDGLKIHPEKTRLLPIGPTRNVGPDVKGPGRPDTFDLRLTTTGASPEKATGIKRKLAAKTATDAALKPLDTGVAYAFRRRVDSSESWSGNGRPLRLLRHHRKWAEPKPSPHRSGEAVAQMATAAKAELLVDLV